MPAEYPYSHNMKIDYDPNEDLLNRRKHGPSLADGAALFEDPDPLIIRSYRERDGEVHFKILGHLRGALHTAVYVHRGDVVRFISVRRSNRHETREYEDRGSG